MVTIRTAQATFSQSSCTWATGRPLVLQNMSGLKPREGWIKSHTKPKPLTEDASRMGHAGVANRTGEETIICTLSPPPCSFVGQYDFSAEIPVRLAVHYSQSGRLTSYSIAQLRDMTATGVLHDFLSLIGVKIF